MDDRTEYYLCPGDEVDFAITSPYVRSGAESMFSNSEVAFFAASGTDRLHIVAEKGPRKAKQRTKQRVRRDAGLRAYVLDLPTQD